MNISVVLWMAPSVIAVALLYGLGHVGWLWRHRAIWGDIIAALLAAALPFLLVADMPLIARLLLALGHCWLILLALRLPFGRLGEAFLRTSTAFNAALASFLLLLVFVVWLLSHSTDWWPTAEHGAYAMLLAAGIAGWIGLAHILWTFRHYRLRQTTEKAPSNPPTVTLAIPARNENHALTDCLAAAVASTYPKLEILVLDDCSQDKTSQIIRAFAHDGVRFISGEQPASGWLGKNQACDMLAREAQGEYIIFAGVDTRLEPHSIAALVAYARKRDLSMVSVLPQVRTSMRASALLQQLRYFWQIALPITKRRVPVASQCWLIKRAALKQLGGFGAVKNKIVPESWFARRLASVDLYRFIVSNPALGFTTAKKWSSQLETALRVLYPTFKRQPLYILAGCLLLLICGLGPFVLLAYLLGIGQFGVLGWVALIVCGLLWLDYALVVARTNPLTWLAMLITLPLCLLQELVLLVLSMLLYEFGQVNWKGRNVCYPVISAASRPTKSPGQ